ncbi:MAG: hypothetical protein ABR568_13895 [Pyrinomonadaceae bacterium]
MDEGVGREFWGVSGLSDEEGSTRIIDEPGFWGKSRGRGSTAVVMVPGGKQDGSEDLMGTDLVVS